MNQAIEILRTVKEKDADEARVGMLLENGFLADALDPRADLTDREAVRAVLGLPPYGPIETTVVFSQSIEEVVALGNMHFRFPEGIDLRRLYPCEGRGIQHYENILLPHQRGTSRRTQVRRMKKCGYFLARHEHGIAFWRALGPKQRWLRIGCLGYLAKADGPDLEREVFCIEGRRTPDFKVSYQFNSRRVHEGLPGIDYILAVKAL